MVKITTANGSQYNEAIATAVGYNSSSDKRVHFGLGDATSDRYDRTLMANRCPSGALKNGKVDQILTVTESSK